MPITNLMLGPIPDVNRKNKTARGIMSWLPYTGTAIDIDTAIEDPTPTNIAFATASTGIDALTFGVGSRALRGVRLAKQMLAEGIEKAARAERKLDQAKRIYNGAKTEKNFNKVKQAEQTYWDAYAKVQNAHKNDSYYDAFAGEYWRNLRDAEDKVRNINIANGLGGTEVQAFNTLIDEYKQDYGRRRLESRGSKSK